MISLSSTSPQSQCIGHSYQRRYCKSTADTVSILPAIPILTGKRGKAQRVARPAHANAIVHFLLTHRQANDV